MRSIYLALFMALLLILAACGGDDPTGAPSTAEASAGTSGTVASASDDAAGTTVIGAPDDSDSIRDVAISPRLTGLEKALNGTAELVDEKSVRLTFESGSVNGTGAFRACAVGPRLLDEGMILIVAYPDGEKTCE